MKLIHVGLIAVAFALLLVGFCPAHSATWEPPVEWDENASWEWLMVCKPAEPIRVYQVSDHFQWEWGQGSYHPMYRIDRAERLLAVVKESRTTQPVATPEPSSVLLLASGLVGVAIRRRKK